MSFVMKDVANAMNLEMMKIIIAQNVNQNILK